MRTAAPARRGDSESGVGATIVVLVLFVLFGVGALAIDVGAAWALRRDLDASVEAAALAGAKVAITDCTDSAVDAEVDRLLTANNVDLTVVTPTVDLDCDNGIVRVAVQEQSFQLFSPIFNRSIASPNAAAAQIGGDEGPAVEATGLRPIGICADSPAYLLWQAELEKRQAWVDAEDGRDRADAPAHYSLWTNAGVTGLVDPYAADEEALFLPGTYDTDNEVRLTSLVEIRPEYAAAADGPVFRMDFGRLKDIEDLYEDFDSGCVDNNVPGSWGWLEFDGSGAAEFVDNMRNGASQTVALDDCYPDSGDGPSCSPKTGSVAGVTGARTDISCSPNDTSCDAVFIVGYSQAAGNGANATFSQVSFMGLKFWCPNAGCASINGNIGPGDYLDVEFTDDILDTGTAGDPPDDVPIGPNAPAGVSICENLSVSSIGLSFCETD